MSAATIDVPVFDLDRVRGARRHGDAVVIVFPARQPATPAVGLRLTRRGRLAITLATVSLLAAVGLVGASTALAGTSVSEPVATEQVVVHPGHTLWGIAAAAAPAGADVRDVIIDIQEMNGLETSAVYAGQELTVPLP